LGSSKPPNLGINSEAGASCPYPRQVSLSDASSIIFSSCATPQTNQTRVVSFVIICEHQKKPPRTARPRPMRPRERLQRFGSNLSLLPLPTFPFPPDADPWPPHLGLCAGAATEYSPAGCFGCPPTRCAVSLQAPPRKSGFNPSRAISPRLRELMNAVTGVADLLPRPSRSNHLIAECPMVWCEECCGTPRQDSRASWGTVTSVRHNGLNSAAAHERREHFGRLTSHSAIDLAHQALAPPKCALQLDRLTRAGFRLIRRRRSLFFGRPQSNVHCSCAWRRETNDRQTCIVAMFERRSPRPPGIDVRAEKRSETAAIFLSGERLSSFVCRVIVGRVLSACAAVLGFCWASRPVLRAMYAAGSPVEATSQSFRMFAVLFLDNPSLAAPRARAPAERNSSFLPPPVRCPGPSPPLVLRLQPRRTAET